MGGAKLHGRKSLVRYEWVNLVLLLFAVVALALFATWVFQRYSNPDDGSASEAVIISEAVVDADICMFTVGTRLTHTVRHYRNPAEIRTDDPLGRKLFGVPGVAQVIINPKSVVIYKLPSARWEVVQSSARGIISDYLEAE
jgi:hypothetical protein